MKEWLSVLVWGALWGGGMAWMTPSRDALFNTRKGRILDVLEWMFGGLLFGVLVTFNWHQVTHPPLVFITIVAFAGVFVSALFTSKQEPGHTEPEEQNPSIPPLFNSKLITFGKTQVVNSAPMYAVRESPLQKVASGGSGLFSGTDSMKEFLLSILPEGSILAVDISGAGREARFYPSEPVFATWNAAAKFFLDLGANQDILNAAQSHIKQYGIAKLAFRPPGNASAA